jgi:hypothetical protein
MKAKCAVLACLLLIAQSALAHHSSSPHFDANIPVVLEGVVTEFRFVNPHAYLYIDVSDENGSVTSWNCEMAAASPLKRSGWTADLFTPGMKVKVEGVAARRDPLGCSFESATLADGTVIARNGPIERSAPAVVEEAAVANDINSIAGNWEPQPRGRRGRGGQGAAPPGGTPEDGPGRAGPPQRRQPPEMTAAGKAAQANFDARYDDPGLECSPSSIIRVWFESGMTNQIEVREDQVVIRHEFMDLVRTVNLGAQKPPDGYEPSLAGFSVGHFEGNELVIETTGFKAGVLQAHTGGGMLHTEQMQVSERLRLSDDGGQLIRDYVVTDPAYYPNPISGSQTWQRSTRALQEFNCVELSGASKVRPEDE